MGWDEMSGCRLAVGFFGIPRSLKWTLSSLEENILSPLRELGTLEVFAHFYRQLAIDNPRSGEDGFLDQSDYGLLTYDGLILEEPGECLEKRGFRDILSYGDPWGDEGKSLSNLVHQLNSLQALSSLIESAKPEVVVLARPDLLYHDNLLPACLEHFRLPPKSITIPDWQWFGGVNDRFAICGYDAFLAYANRIDLVFDYLKANKGGLHSEQFLFYCLNRLGVRIHPGHFCASRVRSNGFVVPESFKPISTSKKIRRLFVNRICCSLVDHR
ncbi:hypothetical protein [Azonexus sp.]|uniref:hypothetical protein n=1 Tax=Azonexus sp. TaxID=1872668 RepID=UPI0035B38CC5